MNDRITALEEKFAFLEHQVEQLDGVIRDVFERVDQLSRELQGVRGAIKRVETELAEGAPEEE